MVNNFPSQTILAFAEDFTVLPEGVYDSLVSGNTLPVDVAFIRNVLEADAEVDTTTTPWQLVFKHKTSKVELIRKVLKDVTGADIISITQIIGQYEEPD